MKILKNNRLNHIILVFLLIISVFWLISKINYIESKSLLSSGFGINLTNHDIPYIMQSSLDSKNFMTVSDHDLPSYKLKISSNVFSNLEVDFSSFTYLDVDKQSKFNNIDKGFEDSKSNNFYKFKSEKSNQNHWLNSNIFFYLQNVSQNENEDNQTTNGIQLGEMITGQFLSSSNPTMNSFLANNTMVITNDMSDFNSPMHVGGGSNPGDPGVPIGDGTYVLTCLIVLYSLGVNYKNKCRKRQPLDEVDEHKVVYIDICNR